ncbi:MAG: amino acid ABC transporter ATP-binding protein [Staphylococcus sp.]|jgi:amino acid ABC transporter ATP-binding protein|nr:amino acid ABC transporter ATP-binding protein [Staphylococcus sp.]
MIKLEHIYKSFNNITILNDINLEIKEGEIISIIGPSGSGKSTILRIINHLISPDSGKVYYNNQLVTDKNAQKIRLKMGMVFQHFELFPHKTVLENIILAPIVHKILTKTEAEAKAKELLKMVDLENKMNAYPNTLSGGQKQRVAIARMLAMNPEVMLFDEPTSALDPEMVKDILDIIKEIATSGKTIIIVTHEMNFAKNISNRILFMDHGNIIQFATPNEIFNNNDNDRINNFLKKVL